MTAMPLYRLLANAIQSRLNCLKKDTVTEWESIWDDRIDQLVKNYLPSGSGFDAGTRVSLDHSTGEKLVLFTDYHHMEENGLYDGWTAHKITVRPSLSHGFTISISGRNKNDIKDYICDVFYDALNTEADYEA